MRLLVKENVIIAYAPKIEFGVYDEPIEKWRLADEFDKTMYYMIDNDFALVEDVELPEDYEEGKYFFEDGAFVLNPEWQPPLPSNEERIAELERQIAELNGDAVWDEIAVAIEEGVNEV